MRKKEFGIVAQVRAAKRFIRRHYVIDPTMVLEMPSTMANEVLYNMQLSYRYAVNQDVWIRL
jgi:hypothetical protein